jgi:hypothetical protein
MPIPFLARAVDGVTGGHILSLRACLASRCGKPGYRQADRKGREGIVTAPWPVARGYAWAGKLIAGEKNSVGRVTDTGLAAGT